MHANFILFGCFHKIIASRILRLKWFAFTVKGLANLIALFSQDLKLQPEDSFVLKVVQLQELLEVRHSVFVIGAPGTGKTQVSLFSFII